VNIFVAGIHGVGKTYLASKLPPTLGLIHTSAGKLISEERQSSNWDGDKRVSDVDANQLALIAAVKRYNSAGQRLLLDGHFVVLNSSGAFVRLGSEVFMALNLDGVVLLETDPHTIATRIRKRDSREVNVGHLVEFIDAERTQAQAVCDHLGISLLILKAATLDTFAEVITKTARKML
jgi:adenylate kinase